MLSAGPASGCVPNPEWGKGTPVRWNKVARHSFVKFRGCLLLLMLKTTNLNHKATITVNTTSEKIRQKYHGFLAALSSSRSLVVGWSVGWLVLLTPLWKSDLQSIKWVSEWVSTYLSDSSDCSDSSEKWQQSRNLSTNKIMQPFHKKSRNLIFFFFKFLSIFL